MPSDFDFYMGPHGDIMVLLKAPKGTDDLFMTYTVYDIPYRKVYKKTIETI